MQERIRVRAGELCVPIAGAGYVRRHAGGGENRAQPQERRVLANGAKPPTLFPGDRRASARAAASATRRVPRAKTGFNATRLGGGPLFTRWREKAEARRPAEREGGPEKERAARSRKGETEEEEE